MVELSASLFSFVLIFLAEFGDKSQIVAMTLACRLGARPVFLGAVVAFALLNVLAVTVGASIATLVPAFWLSLATALLFAVFGIYFLLENNEDDESEQSKLNYSSVFFSVLVLMFIAELGDKTQIAVATLATSHPINQVWLGATAALTLSTLLAVVLGKVVLNQSVSKWLHKGSGLLFIAFAIFTSWQAFLLN